MKSWNLLEYSAGLTLEMFCCPCTIDCGPPAAEGADLSSCRHAAPSKTHARRWDQGAAVPARLPGVLNLLGEVVLLQNVDDAKVEDHRPALRRQRPLHHALGRHKHPARHRRCSHVQSQRRARLPVKLVLVLLLLKRLRLRGRPPGAAEPSV